MMTRQPKTVYVGNARVTINLPDDLARWVKAQAREQAKTVSAMFREWAATERNRVKGATA